MDDVKKDAAERAARPNKTPVGAGFESERQREKNALVRQLDAQDGRNVHKIAAAWKTVFFASRHTAVCQRMI